MLYQQQLDAAELHDAMAFLRRSPWGARLAAVAAQAIIHAPPPDELADKAYNPPMPDPYDAAAKRAFDATPAGRKLLALQPQIDAIIATWNDAPMPQTDARIDAAMAKVLVRFNVTEADMPDADQGTRR